MGGRIQPESVSGLVPQRENQVLFSEEGGKNVEQTKQQVLHIGAMAGGKGADLS